MNCVSTMTLSKTTTNKHDLRGFTFHSLLSQSLSQAYSRKDFLSIEWKISIEYPAKVSRFFFYNLLRPLCLPKVKISSPLSL